MRHSRALLWPVLVLVAAALVWWSGELTKAPGPGAVSAAVIELAAAPDCDPAPGPCPAHGTAGVLYLELGPEVRPLVPFPVQVRVEPGAGVRDVQLEFYMQGMEMGLNRYRLKAGDDGVWEGEVILPVCTRDRADWMVRVHVRRDEAVWVAAFAFRSGGR